MTVRVMHVQTMQTDGNKSHVAFICWRSAIPDDVYFTFFYTPSHNQSEIVAAMRNRPRLAPRPIHLQRPRLALDYAVYKMAMNYYRSPRSQTKNNSDCPQKNRFDTGTIQSCMNEIFRVGPQH